MTDQKPDDQYTDEEAARRRDEVLKRMLNTPPQPHKPAVTKKARPSSKGRVRKGKSRV